MSRLIEIQEQLQDASATLAQIEQAIAANPQSYGLVINGRSVKKRFRELESEFHQLTAEAAIDVCRYRLFHDPRITPTIAAVASALNDFQGLFTTAYDAIKTGPKKKSAVRPEAVKESSLGFGYSFAGSVGVVMTLANSQILPYETPLDATMEAVFSLAQAQTEQEVLLSSAALGGPTIKAMRQWIAGHVNNDLGLDVQWFREQRVKGRLAMQLPELRHLASVLDEASEPVNDTLVVAGVLVGTETSSSHTCHFITDNNDEIRGPYSSNVISLSNPVKMPGRYEATFERKAKKVIATDEERDATYRLIALKPLG
jgi:hypothetical protein